MAKVEIVVTQGRQRPIGHGGRGQKKSVNVRQKGDGRPTPTSENRVTIAKLRLEAKRGMQGNQSSFQPGNPQQQPQQQQQQLSQQASRRSTIPNMKHRVLLCIEIDPNLFDPCTYERELIPFVMVAEAQARQQETFSLFERNRAQKRYFTSYTECKIRVNSFVLTILCHLLHLGAHCLFFGQAGEAAKGDARNNV